MYFYYLFRYHKSFLFLLLHENIIYLFIVLGTSLKKCLLSIFLYEKVDNCLSFFVKKKKKIGVKNNTFLHLYLIVYLNKKKVVRITLQFLQFCLKCVLIWCIYYLFCYHKYFIFLLLYTNIWNSCLFRIFCIKINLLPPFLCD